MIGLDWENEDINEYMRSEKKGFVPFLNSIAIKLRQGACSGAVFCDFIVRTFGQ